MSKIKPDKTNPNKIKPDEIGIVTIDISNGSISGKFKSPLLLNKSTATTLYIPKYRSLFRGNELLPSLQRYIGIDKVGYSNKHKWLVNAKHLFMNKAAVETYLRREGYKITEKRSPDVFVTNAKYIIKEIFFPQDQPFIYANKKWKIKSIMGPVCDFTGYWKNQDKLLAQIEATELQRIIKKYRDRVDQYQKVHGVRSEDVQLFKQNIRLQQEKEYKDFVKKVDNFRKTKKDPDIENKLNDVLKLERLRAPLLCKVKLTVEDTSRRKVTKKIGERFSDFKKSCRKGDFVKHSAKQRDIIRTCRVLCRSHKYSKWCKTCSVFVNCILEPDNPIDSSKLKTSVTKLQTSAATGATNRRRATKNVTIKSASLGPLPKGWTVDPVTGKTKAPQWSPPKTKKPVAVVPATAGGQKKKKYSRRGSNP